MLDQQITALLTVLGDDRYGVDERVAAVAATLNRMPDRGAAAAAAVAGTHARGSFAATYLSQLPGHHDLKAQVVRRCLDGDGRLARNACTLIHDLTGDQIGEVLDFCARVGEHDPAEAVSDAYNLLYEVAMDHPARMRDRLRDGPRPPLCDDTIDDLLLAGADAQTVAALAGAYRRTGDPDLIDRLARVRTDAALDALLSLPAGADREAVLVAVQNSGVQPDTRQASVFFRAYRGYVMPVGSTAHVMGGVPGHAVPQCPVCDTVATRLLRLDRAALAAAGITLNAPYDPGFYWYTCAHPPGSISVQHTPDGPAGLLTGPMRTPPAPAGTVMPALPGQPGVPGEFSLLLVADPDPAAAGTGPGFGRHRVGGHPPWPARAAAFPHCPVCGKYARFLAAVDVTTPYGRLELGDTDAILGFWCDPCAVSISVDPSADAAADDE